MTGPPPTRRVTDPIFDLVGNPVRVVSCCLVVMVWQCHYLCLFSFWFWDSCCLSRFHNFTISLCSLFGSEIPVACHGFTISLSLFILSLALRLIVYHRCSLTISLLSLALRLLLLATVSVSLSLSILSLAILLSTPICYQHHLTCSWKKWHNLMSCHHISPSFCLRRTGLYLCHHPLLVFPSCHWRSSRIVSIAKNT